MIPKIESPERIRELLLRNLEEVFGEGDATRRSAAIKALWAEDGVLYAPMGPITGHAAIAEFAGELRTMHAAFAYVPGNPQMLHNAGRLGWGSGPRGEAPAYTGSDFILVREGRIAALYVFLDEGSAEAQRMQHAAG
jgi:hypothetical protein